MEAHDEGRGRLCMAPSEPPLGAVASLGGQVKGLGVLKMLLAKILQAAGGGESVFVFVRGVWSIVAIGRGVDMMGRYV